MKSSVVDRNPPSAASPPATRLPPVRKPNVRDIPPPSTTSASTSIGAWIVPVPPASPKVAPSANVARRVKRARSNIRGSGGGKGLPDGPTRRSNEAVSAAIRTIRRPEGTRPLLVCVPELCGTVPIDGVGGHEWRQGVGLPEAGTLVRPDVAATPRRLRPGDAPPDDMLAQRGRSD